MKKSALTILLFLIIFSTQLFAYSYSFTAMKSDQDSLVIAGAKTFAGKYELGVHAIMNDLDVADDAYNLCIGPYVAADIPIPDMLNFGNDYKLYGGLALPYSLKHRTLAGKPFIAGILYPDREISPVVTGAYNILDGSVSEEDDLKKGYEMFAGFRIMID